MQSRSATLLISCPDRKGLVASVTNFIANNNGNILHLDQHVDAAENVFFMRVVWDLETFSIHAESVAEAFQPIAQQFNMTWDLRFSWGVPRMAIFVSKESHCLYDILARWQSGEWQVEIPLIISNHPDLGTVAEKFGVAYQVLPVTKDNKLEVEQQQIALVEQHRADFIVLARYMQI